MAETRDWAQLSFGVSTGGNTAGSTGMANNAVLFYGGANITLSQSSAPNCASITFIGGAGGAGFTGGAGTAGNTLGTTGTVNNGILFVGGTNITLSQSSGAGGATVSILGQSGTQPPIATAVYAVSNVGSTGTVTRFSPEDHKHIGLAGVNMSGTASTFVGNLMISVGNLLTMSTAGNSSAGTLELFNLLSSSAQVQPVSNISGAGTNSSRYALADHAHIGLAGVNASGTASTFVGNLMLSGTNLTLVTGGNSSAGSIGFSVANAAKISSYYQPAEGGVSSVALTAGSHSVQLVEIPYPISFTRVDVPILVSLGSAATTATADINISSALMIYTMSINGTSSTLNPITGSFGTTTYTWASNTSNFSNLTGGKNASFAINTTLSQGIYYVGFQMSTTNNSSVGLSTTLLGNTISLMVGANFSVSNFNDFGVAPQTYLNMPMGRGVAGVTKTATNDTIALTNLNQSFGLNQQANFPVFFRGVS